MNVLPRNSGLDFGSKLDKVITFLLTVNFPEPVDWAELIRSTRSRSLVRG